MASTRGFSFVQSEIVSNTIIDSSRNQLFAAALESDARLALVIDDDTWWAPDQTGHVFQMLAEALECALVGVNCPTRDGRPTAYGHDDKPLPLRSTVTSGFQYVKAVTTGLLAVNLEWYRRRWPWGDSRVWFQSMQSWGDSPGKVQSYGEDYRFADITRERGGRIACKAGFYVNNHRTIHPRNARGGVSRPLSK